MPSLDIGAVLSAATSRGVDVDALTKAAAQKGMSITDLAAQAAAHGVAIEVEAQKHGVVGTVNDIMRRVGATVSKAEATYADIGTGAAAGAAIGSVIPGVGTVIGGAVGTIGGAVYGVVDNFGADIADFASGIFGGGPDPTCLDFWRNPTTCKDIDMRMNNLVKMQRDLRADTSLLKMSPDAAHTKWNVDPRYADHLLQDERKRDAFLSSNEKMADHMLHARPDAILGLAPLFGVWFHSQADIEKHFKVKPQFAAQMISAARKLYKPAPKAAPMPTRTVQILPVSSLIRIGSIASLLPKPGAPAPAPPPPPPPPPPAAVPVAPMPYAPPPVAMTPAEHLQAWVNHYDYAGPIPPARQS